MCLPVVLTWIEKANPLFRAWVNACCPVTFCQIAVRAGQAQILSDSQPASRLRNDMFEMKGLANDCLWSMAVFTLPSCSQCHERCQPGRYSGRHFTVFPFRLSDSALKAASTLRLTSRPFLLNSSGRMARARASVLSIINLLISPFNRLSSASSARDSCPSVCLSINSVSRACFAAGSRCNCTIRVSASPAVDESTFFTSSLCNLIGNCSTAAKATFSA